MRTMDYFKDLVSGFLMVMCLGLVPVEILVLIMAPVLLLYISPLFFAIIMVVSLVASVGLAIFGGYLVFHTFAKYVNLVKSNHLLFTRMYNNEARAIIFARKLHAKVSSEKNNGFEQAKVLLKAVYVVCRNPFIGISNRKLSKLLDKLQSVCPEIFKIEIRSEFHPEGTREYLYVDYYVGSSLKSVSILMATLEYNQTD